MRLAAVALLALVLAGCAATPAARTSTGPPAACAGIAGPGFCASVMQGGGLRDLEASLAVSPSDPRTAVVAWSERPAALHHSRAYAAITHDAGATWASSLLEDPSVLVPPGAERYSFDTTTVFSSDGRPMVLYGGDNVEAARAVGPIDARTYGSDRITLAIGDGSIWSYHPIWDAKGGAVSSDFMDIAVAPDTGHMFVVAGMYERPGALASATASTPVGDEESPLPSLGIWLWRSVDGGATWTRTIAVASGATSFEDTPRVAAGTGGFVLIVNGHGEGANGNALDTAVRMSVSRDDGASFATSLLDTNGATFTSAPIVTGDRSDLLLNHGHNVTSVTTLDRGTTWSAPAPLASLPADAWWEMAASVDGKLAALVAYSNACEAPDAPRVWGVKLVNEDRAIDIAGPEDKSPTPCGASDDYGGFAIGPDRATWMAWSDPRGDAPRIAVARLDPTSAR